MKKFILLGIPIFFYRNSILYFYYNLEGLINLIVILICLIFLLKRTTFRNMFDWFIGICFVIYFCILYYQTIYLRGFIFEGYNHSVENLKSLFYTINLIPIKGIISEITINPSVLSALYQIFGNTFMLTPFTFAMLYFKWTKSYKQTIWYSFICTAGIELIQFFQSLFYALFVIGLRRSTDIDDIILNTIGAGIGIGCYYLWSKIEIRFNKGNSNISI
ncbi:VanZ family protein [Lederbergia graminis]|uniref:VanZ family protein n=1 Tax=Lederbergia graminis TaxID=735518 RepID=A0ABW0LGS6_9BACI